tara:strand:+ start:1609 stop:2814 length:1206 start_codon:yes stop_codon:yes gene_type:complete
MNLETRETKNVLDHLATDETVTKTLKRLQTFSGEHSVVVGLSGGVDSSLTAALLCEAGWEVVGLTLWLMKGKGSCCSDGLIDAARICDQLGIKHHILDSKEIFQKEIINSVVQGYEEGITPLPCSRCNKSVKFSEMLKWINDQKNIDKIATGHYARIKYSNESFSKNDLPGDGVNRHKLLRGKDPNKDQSYFLYDLPQRILGKTIFPLGELTKEITRIEALKHSLKTAEKPESQDLCLAEHYGSMHAFIDKYLPKKEGDIVLQDGQIVGSHNGIQHFTIGQRKGLGIAWKVPLHVIKIDASLNRVIVAPRDDSGKSDCFVKDINWVSIEAPKEPIKAEVQIRYRSKAVKAKLIPISNSLNENSCSKCHIYFDEEQFSVTPGQAAVFYKGDFVLGGGIISKN